MKNIILNTVSKTDMDLAVYNEAGFMEGYIGDRVTGKAYVNVKEHGYFVLSAVWGFESTALTEMLDVLELPHPTDERFEELERAISKGRSMYTALKNAVDDHLIEQLIPFAERLDILHKDIEPIEQRANTDDIAAECIKFMKASMQSGMERITIDSRSTFQTADGYSFIKHAAIKRIISAFKR